VTFLYSLTWHQTLDPPEYWAYRHVPPCPIMHFFCFRQVGLIWGLNANTASRVSGLTGIQCVFVSLPGVPSGAQHLQ
jgi:hypothetical protein